MAQAGVDGAKVAVISPAEGEIDPIEMLNEVVAVSEGDGVPEESKYTGPSDAAGLTVNDRPGSDSWALSEFASTLKNASSVLGYVPPAAVYQDVSVLTGAIPNSAPTMSSVIVANGTRMEA
jgi:hypothetical protein